MSAILPIETTSRPAFDVTSSSVGDGGGMAKSRRLPVRVNVLRSAPTNGRAMTRPIIIGSMIFARRPADFEQPLEAERLFVRGDLQHRIGGGVEDRLAGSDMLLAILGDDVGAGSMLEAEHAGEPATGDQRLGDRGWDRWNGVREVAPFERHRHAGRFPNGRTACPCPCERSVAAPQRPVGRVGRSRPGGNVPLASSTASPRPSAERLGNVSCRRPGTRPAAQASAMWPTVFDPASPYSAASGAPPMPTESRITRIARGIEETHLLSEVHRPPNRCQAPLCIAL